MFDNINRISRLELTEEVKSDLLSQEEHNKLDSLVVNDNGTVSLAYSITINGVNNETYTFNGSDNVVLEITPATIGAATANHTHPDPTNISGNAATASKLKTPINIGSASFDGSASISLSDIGAAATNHNHDTTYSSITHNHDDDYAAIVHNHDYVYAESDIVGGSALSAKKLDNSVTITVLGGATGSVSFDGSEKEVTLTLDVSTGTTVTIDNVAFTSDLLLDASNFTLSAREDGSTELGRHGMNTEYSPSLNNRHENYAIFEFYYAINADTTLTTRPIITLDGGDPTTDNNGDSVKYLYEFYNEDKVFLGSFIPEDGTTSIDILANTMFIKMYVDFKKITIPNNRSAIIYIDPIEYDLYGMDLLGMTSEKFIGASPSQIPTSEDYISHLSIFKLRTSRTPDLSMLDVIDKYGYMESLDDLVLQIECSSMDYGEWFGNLYQFINDKPGIQLSLPKPKSLTGTFMGSEIRAFPKFLTDFSECVDLSNVCNGNIFISAVPDLSNLTPNIKYGGLDHAFSECDNIGGEVHISTNTTDPTVTDVFLGCEVISRSYESMSKDFDLKVFVDHRDRYRMITAANKDPYCTYYLDSDDAIFFDFSTYDEATNTYSGWAPDSSNPASLIINIVDDNSNTIPANIFILYKNTAGSEPEYLTRSIIDTSSYFSYSPNEEIMGIAISKIYFNDRFYRIYYSVTGGTGGLTGIEVGYCPYLIYVINTDNNLIVNYLLDGINNGYSNDPTSAFGTTGVTDTTVRRFTVNSANITCMVNMFYGCTKLEVFDIYSPISFMKTLTMYGDITSSLRRIDRAFYNCISLKRIPYLYTYNLIGWNDVFGADPDSYNKGDYSNSMDFIWYINFDQSKEEILINCASNYATSPTIDQIPFSTIIHNIVVISWASNTAVDTWANENGYSVIHYDDFISDTKYAKAKRREITIEASNWSSSYPYTNTVYVEGIKSTDDIKIISVKTTDTDTEDDIKAYTKAAGYLIYNENGVRDGFIVFKAYKLPEVDFTVITEGG